MGKLIKSINTMSFPIKLNSDSFTSFHNAINLQILELDKIEQHELGKKLVLNELLLLDEKLCKVSYWTKPVYSFRITRSQALTLMIIFNGFQSEDIYQANVLRKILNPINQLLL